MEVLTVHGPRYSPYSNYDCLASDVAALGIISNIFSYDVVFPGFKPIAVQYTFFLNLTFGIFYNIKKSSNLHHLNHLTI